MASNSTPNYSLPQWEMDDRILVEDFNEAMHNIDEALSLKTQVLFGSYEGDGAEERTVSLGKTPKAVLLMNNRGEMSYQLSSTWTGFGGLAVAGSPITHTSGTKILEVVAGGFKVYCSDSTSAVSTNRSGITYNYIALC